MRSLPVVSVICGLLCSVAVTTAKPIQPLKGVLDDGAVVVEKTSATGQFVDRELQQRASRFLTAATERFAVDGASLPLVPFNVGESYAGLLPISGVANETRKLFFWFFPSTNPTATAEITIWLNGGPGCSSLEGFLSENGPISWLAGTQQPTQNPYSWTNLTNMVWIDQPVGTGFTQGEVDIVDDFGLADEFVGFWEQFATTFCMEDWKVYLTGESYAGVYIPYIASAFIDVVNKTYYNLAGIAMNDAVYGDSNMQMNAPLVSYVNAWNQLIYLNDSFLARINRNAEDCQYTSYLETYLRYPPPQVPFPQLPYPPQNSGCDFLLPIQHAAQEVNPCFSWYSINQQCPWPYSVLGSADGTLYIPPGQQDYFDRADVQAAIHAPAGMNWTECSSYVYRDQVTGQLLQGDQNSTPPAMNGVLQKVIEYTNNTVIGSGNLDLLIPTNGSLLILQNTTWNGKQGLQRYPDVDFFVPYHPEYNQGALGGAGRVGLWGVERGLTFYQVQLAGHELPRYAPGAAYRVLEYLLGRIDSLSLEGDFTTQSGVFTGPSWPPR